jgi:hypothetical protein
MRGIDPRPTTKDILLPEFTERIIGKPTRELSRIQSLKYGLTLASFHHKDIFRNELIQQKSRLR